MANGNFCVGKAPIGKSEISTGQKHSSGKLDQREFTVSVNSPTDGSVVLHAPYDANGNTVLGAKVSSLRPCETAKAWIAGEIFRIAHTIKQSTTVSGIGINAQQMIRIHYGTGTNTDKDVYMGGRCKSDFSDIVITNGDGLTVLAGLSKGWRQQKVDANYADIWFKCPVDLSLQNCQIFIYCGAQSLSWLDSVNDTFAIINNLAVNLPLNVAEESSNVKVIYDDDKSVFGFSATAQQCTIYDESSIVIKNTKSLKIVNGTITSNGGGWFTFSGADRDFTSYDCLSLYMYGTNTNRNITIRFIAANWSNQYTYAITNNFNGWKRIVIPFLTMSVIGSPDLSNVWQLYLDTGQSASSGDIFYFDRIILDTLENNPTILADDGSVAGNYWVTTTTGTTGSIQLDTFIDDTNRVRGTNAPKVTVKSGSGTGITIQHNFGTGVNAANWSNKDYMFLSILGRNTGTSISVYVVFTDGLWNHNVEYTITDNWGTTWRRFVLPFSLFTTRSGTPDWSNVTIFQIAFRGWTVGTSASFDRVGLDSYATVTDPISGMVGKVIGAVPTADGKFGYGLQFNGNSNIQFANGLHIGQSSFTSIAYFKRYGASGGTSVGTRHALVGGINGVRDMYLSVLSDGASVRNVIKTQDITFPDIVQSGTNYDNHKLAAGIYDYENSKIKVAYGSNVTEANAGSSPIFINGTDTFRIGCQVPTSYNTANGIISDVLIFSIPISETQLTNIVNNYPDTNLIQGSVVCRKWTGQASLHGEWGTFETQTFNNMNFTLTQPTIKDTNYFIRNPSQKNTPLNLNESETPSYYDLSYGGSGGSVGETTIASEPTPSRTFNGTGVRFTAHSGTGTYSVPYKIFTPTLNLTNYDTISVYVYGGGSGNTIQMRLFLTSNGSKKAIYSIVDNFTGLQRKTFVIRNPSATEGSPITNDYNTTYQISFVMSYLTEGQSITISDVLFDSYPYIPAQKDLQFYVKNPNSTQEQNPLVLIDEDTNNLTGEVGGTGLGNLGTPTYTLDSSKSVVSSNSVKATVSTNGTAQWAGVSYRWSTNVDISAYDVLSLWLYGIHDGSTFFIGLKDSAGANGSNVTVIDNFDGWRKFVFLLRNNNWIEWIGSGISLNSVRYITVRTNVARDINIDRMILDICPYNYVNKASMEFIVDNRAEDPDTIVLADDIVTELTGFGAPNTGIYAVDASGLDTTMAAKGSASFYSRAKLGGTGNAMSFTKSFTTEQDWRNHDFITFWYYGINTGLTNVLYVNTPDWNNSKRFKFIDNFTGWKRIIFPLKAPHDGNNVVVAGTFDLQRVKLVSLECMVAAAGNTFHIDRLCVCKGTWAKIEIAVPDTLYTFGNYLAKSSMTYSYLYVNISTWSIISNAYAPSSGNYELYTDANDLLSSSNHRFLDGSSLQMYGDTNSWESKYAACKFIQGSKGETKTRTDGNQANQSITYSQVGTTTKRIGFAIKMPPSDCQQGKNSGMSQVKCKLDIYYP